MLSRPPLIAVRFSAGRPLAAILGGLLLGLSPLAAQAAPPEPVADAGADCGPYRVGLREYPQLYQRQGDGRHEGLDREFFEQLTARSGCRFSFQLESQPRIWQHLRSGSLDLASWVVPSAERQVLVHMIPLLTARPMAVTWRERGPMSQADFLADTQLKAVAIRQALYGPGYDALLQRLREQGRLSEVADFETALRAFAAHRGDLLIAFPWSLAGQPWAWLEQLRFSDWHAGAGSLYSTLALSRSTVRPADLRRIERALRAMQQDGSLAQLVGRYLPPEGVQVLPAGTPLPPLPASAPARAAPAPAPASR